MHYSFVVPIGYDRNLQQVIDSALTEATFEPHDLCKSASCLSQEGHQELYLTVRPLGFLISYFQLVMGEGPSLMIIFSLHLDDQS